MSEYKIYSLHMGKAKCAVDLGDGSERGEYVNQDYILNKMGRPHRSISLMDEYENETEDRANIPLENILSKERNRLLYHAIEHLPERQREIVMMQYFGGLGQKEIAKVLHMTPENVRVSAHRAKKQMKNYMEGQGYEL